MAPDSYVQVMPPRHRDAAATSTLLVPYPSSTRTRRELGTATTPDVAKRGTNVERSEELQRISIKLSATDQLRLCQVAGASGQDTTEGEYWAATTRCIGLAD
jgi:hypothetical protein